jgi:hypothetical protein
MSFHNRQAKFPAKPQVSINGTNITYISQTKFLGIHLTETLDWNTHLEVLATKLSKVIFIIKSTKEILTSKKILNISFAKFQSLMSSGLLFWGGICLEHTKRILKIQKRAVRIMVGINTRTSCSKVFKELNILTLPSLYILETACFVGKH